MGLFVGGLVRELAERRGELIPATASAGGGVNTLVSDEVAEYLTEETNLLHAWVYLNSMIVSPNAGISRRAYRYTPSPPTLYFTRTWPAAPAVDEPYYVTTRNRWDRLREAVLSGLSTVSLPFAREMTATPIPIVSEQYRYDLPAGALTADMVSELTISVSTTDPDYPYASTIPYNWRLYKEIDDEGQAVYTIQFQEQPPEGHLLRVYGQGPLVRPVEADGDSGIIPVEPQYNDAVREYLMMHASYIMAAWDVDTEPVGKAAYALAVSRQALEACRLELQDRLPRGPNARIVVPGRGTGVQGSWSNDSDWLAASHTTH